jgi:DNA-binding NarL/FixJ family response regulator
MVNSGRFEPLLASTAVMLAAPTALTLTERQRQVIQLIAQGYSNVEIAEALGISPRTVKAHSDALRTKLRVHRRRQIPAAFRELTGEDPHALESLGSERGRNRASRMPR